MISKTGLFHDQPIRKVGTTQMLETGRVVYCSRRTAKEGRSLCQSSRERKALMSQMLTFVADALHAPTPLPWPSGRLIRSITPEDAIALGRLYYEAYDPGLACETVEEAIADIRATFQGTYGVLWLAASSVIEHEGKLVAAMLVVHRAPWEDTPDCPFIIELFTARSFRRQGLARALLSRCLLLVGATERPHLALRVHAANKAALQLYASLGFHQWRGALGA